MENNQGLDEAYSTVKLEIIARGNAEDHYVQFNSLRKHRFGKSLLWKYCTFPCNESVSPSILGLIHVAINSNMGN